MASNASPSYTYSYQSAGNSHNQKPYFRIKEQPGSVRFRYESEKSPSIIPGKDGGCPSIQVENHNGPFVVVVSLVTADDSHKQHPFVLKGTDCEATAGYFRKKVVENDNRVVRLANLNLIQTSESEYDTVLTERERKGIDPSKAKFSHLTNSDREIDKHTVCLAVQVFLKDAKGKYSRPLPPVYSEPIRNKKSELKILHLSHTVSPSEGGERMILLTSKITKDVNVRFYKERAGMGTIWEADGEVEIRHSGCAIVLKTPKFETPECKLDIRHPDTKVKMKLYKRNDETDCSEPYPFAYRLLTPNADVAMYNLMNREKRKTDNQINPFEPPEKKKLPTISEASVSARADNQMDSAQEDVIPSVIPSSSTDSGGLSSRNISSSEFAFHPNYNVVDETLSGPASQRFDPASRFHQQNLPGAGGTTHQPETRVDSTKNSLEEMMKELGDALPVIDESEPLTLHADRPQPNEQQAVAQHPSISQLQLPDSLNPESFESFSSLASDGSRQSFNTMLNTINTEEMVHLMHSNEGQGGGDADGIQLNMGQSANQGFGRPP